MKRPRTLLRRTAAVFISVIMGITLAPLPAAAAGSASLSLTPADGTASGKDGLTLAVYEDSGDQVVNAVQAELTFDPTVLQYTSVDGANSAFQVAAPISTSDGLVRIPRGNTPPGLTGRRLVANVHFNVIGSTADAAVNFGKGSSILTADSSSEVWNGTTTGGTFALSDPAAASTAPSSATEGFPVAIVVRDKQGVAVQGATVSLGKDRAATTDVKGVASFPNVPQGHYDTTVSRDGTSVTNAVEVQEAPTQAVQEHSFKLAAAKKADVAVPYGAFVAGIAVIAIGALVAWRWHRRVLAHHLARTSSDTTAKVSQSKEDK